MCPRVYRNLLWLYARTVHMFDFISVSRTMLCAPGYTGTSCGYMLAQYICLILFQCHGQCYVPQGIQEPLVAICLHSTYV